MWLYGLLRRRTSTGEFLPQIDGLRWYAIAAVVLHHCGGYAIGSPASPHAEAFRSHGVARFVSYGALGVNLFFVLSGFVVGLPFARAAARGDGCPSLRRYYGRRVLRIEPPYIINLALLTAAHVAWRGERLGDLAPHFVANLFYCHGLVFGTWSPINFVAWSLEVEVQFYLLAPLLAAIFVLPGMPLRILAAGLLALGAALLADGPVADVIGASRAKLTVLPYLPFFLGGFLLADRHARSPYPLKTAVLGDAMAVPSLAGVAWFGGQAGVAATFGLAASLSGLCFSAIAGRAHARFLSWAPLVVVGGMCYTTYLYHAAVMAVVGPGLCRTLSPLGSGVCPFVALMAAFGVVITLACVPLYLLFEKPFMGLGSGVIQGNTALPASCRVLPATVPFAVPGFARQRRAEDFTFAPAQIECTAWFDSFADRVEAAIGRHYVPICRLGDGEFEFLFGPALWNPRLPPLQRAASAARALTWRWLHHRPGFHAATAPGISSGDMTPEEWHAHRPIFRKDVEAIARDGVLAMHLSYGKEPFQESYFRPLGKWLRESGIRVTVENYVPFYFVYALLRGPRAERLLQGRRVLVVHSAAGARKAAIRDSLQSAGASKVEWLAISPTRAFAERLDLRTLKASPELCLVGAGIGKPRILRQLEPLSVPCIDAGFTFDVWADPDRQWDRPYMTPDSAFDPTRVRYLESPPAARSRAAAR